MKETKVYIVNLRSYNNGMTRGAWFDLPVDFNSVMEKIGVDGTASGGEEYAIHDKENPYGLPITEYSSIEQLNEWAEQLDSLPDNVLKNLKSIIAAGYETIEKVLDSEGENYEFYEASSLESLGMEIIDETGIRELSNETLSFYFDYEAYARDYSIENSVFDGDDGKIEYRT